MNKNNNTSGTNSGSAGGHSSSSTFGSTSSHSSSNSTGSMSGTGGYSAGNSTGHSSSHTMDDKTIMESLLNSTKGVCDLYLHGTIESATPDVHSAFDCVLSDSLTMQSDIYSKMSSKGWYPSQQAQEQQVQQVKTKFSSGIQG